MPDFDTGPADAGAGDNLRADLMAALDGDAGPGLGHNGGPELETEPAAGRDERGRFAAREGSNNQAPQGAEEQAGLTRPKGGSGPESSAPPDGWPADATTQWGKLPRPVQDALRADLAAGKLGGGAGASVAPDPVRDAIRPFEQDIARRGATPEQAVAFLFQAQQRLDADLLGGIAEIARSYGQDPAAIAQQILQRFAPQQAQQEPQGWTDPQVAGLQQRLQQLEGHLSQQQRAEHTRRVEAFAADKSHPHFQAVRADMARLIESGVAADLQDAYDKAVWSRPDIRARVLEAERAAAAEQQRKTATEARQRGGSVRGSPVVADLAQPAADNLRAEILRAMAE